MQPAALSAVGQRLDVRVEVSRRRGRDDRVLISSLLDESVYSDQGICALRDRRRDAEPGCRSSKDTPEAGVLDCRTLEMVIKELLVHLPDHCLIHLLVGEAAQSLGCRCHVRERKSR